MSQGSNNRPRRERVATLPPEACVVWAHERVDGEVVARPRVEYPVGADWLAVADVVVADNGSPRLERPTFLPRTERARAGHYPPTAAWRTAPPAKLALALEEVVRRMQAGDYEGQHGRLSAGDFDAVVLRAGFDLDSVGTVPSPQYRGRSPAIDPAAPDTSDARPEPEPAPEQRAARCGCERPLPSRNEDGDVTCSRCGRSL